MFEAERGEKNVRRRVPLTAARRSGQCSSNLPRTHDFYPRVGRRRNAEKRVSDAALQREKQITSMNQIEAERKIRQISSIGQIFMSKITGTISITRERRAKASVTTAVPKNERRGVAPKKNGAGPNSVRRTTKSW